MSIWFHAFIQWLLYIKLSTAFNTLMYSLIDYYTLIYYVVLKKR